MLTKPTLLLAATALLLGGAGTAQAKQWQVKMVNKGSMGFMTFEPAFLKVNPGDTVKFVAADKAHNAESITTMLPAGATPFKGALNQDVEVAFKAPGLYGYKCTPHFGMGMVGLIEVKSAANKAAVAGAANALPGLAKTRMTTLLAQAK